MRQATLHCYSVHAQRTLFRELGEVLQHDVDPLLLHDLCRQGLDVFPGWFIRLISVHMREQLVMSSFVIFAQFDSKILIHALIVRAPWHPSTLCVL